MTEFDGRRRRYVPLDVMVAFEDFGTKLLGRWGMEGLCAWMLFLAACKREMNQGTFTYSSEEEGWAKLGAKATTFTLDDFFKWTGTQKKTTKKRSGRVRYVKCSVWDKWNTQIVSQQKPRKQPQSTSQPLDESGDLPAPEVEQSRGEREVDLPAMQGFGLDEGKLAELDKLLKLRDATMESLPVLRPLVYTLPLSIVADVRERAMINGKGVGWVVRALKGERDGMAA